MKLARQGKAFGRARQRFPAWRLNRATVPQHWLIGIQAFRILGVDEMVADLRAALDATLRTVTWMDEPTRRSALGKAAAMVSQTVAPETTPPLADLQFDPAKWLENSVAVAREAFRQNSLEADKPVDPKAWYTSALTVNAYYDPQRNAIVVPAGILQPPFFGSAFPAAMNYGSIGAIVAHELTHGFDSNGSRFDAMGRLRDWWSAQSATEFARRTQCYIEQYSAFEPFPGVWRVTLTLYPSTGSTDRLPTHWISRGFSACRLQNTHVVSGEAARARSRRPRAQAVTSQPIPRSVAWPSVRALQH